MTNIGRALVLYNDYIPPMESSFGGDLPCWKAFGYYDDIQVGENIFADGVKIRVLGKETVRLCNTLEGKNTPQPIWLFRTENGTGKDEAFWKEAFSGENFPFLFVSLIQASDRISDMENHCRRDAFEQGLEERYSGELRAITYLTMDHSDIVLILLSKTYECGAKTAAGIRSRDASALEEAIGRKPEYNYTVAGINRVFLNHSEKLDEMTGQIPDTYIYLMEKSSGSLGELAEALGQSKRGDATIERASLLGCNDERVTLRNWRWNDFLKLYRDETGIYNHTSEIFKRTCNGITTIIGITKEVEADSHAVENTYKNDRLLTEDLIQKIQELEKENFDSRFDTLAQHTIKILNSLGKFEISPLNDYLFHASIHQIETVLDIWHEIDRACDAEEKKVRTNAFFDSAFEFVREFNLSMQNGVRPERQFTQVPDFDIKIYDTPVKLNVLYNAFIHILTRFLNTPPAGGTHKYEFLAYPGITDIVKVREVFKGLSKDKRLFLMELPESTSYMPRGIELVLGHEVSHFVGGKIRNRESRKDAAVKIISEITVTIICAEVFECLEKTDGGKWLHKAEYILQCIEPEALAKSFAENLSAGLEDVIGKEGYPGERLEMLLTEGMISLCSMHMTGICADLSDALFTVIIQEGEKEETAETASEEFRAGMEDYLNHFMRYRAEKNSNDVKRVVKTLFYFFRECLSDIMCIHILNIRFDKYLGTLIGELSRQNDSHIEEDTLFLLRMALVYMSVCKDDDPELQAAVSNSENKELLEKVIRKVKFIKTSYTKEETYSIIETAKDIFEKKVPAARPGYKNDYIDFFENTGALMEIHRYLMRCENDLQAQMRNKAASDDLRKVREIYQLFDGDAAEINLEENLIKMQRHVDAYMRLLEKRKA